MSRASKKYFAVSSTQLSQKIEKSFEQQTKIYGNAIITGNADLLEKADKLNKQGKTDEAMKLVVKAKEQGELAVAQAELQASVNGPH